MKLQRLCHDIFRAVCICAGLGCVRKLRRIGIKMPFNVCWLFEKITSRELSPWHAIHSCSGQKVTIPELIRPLSFALISSMMWCFNALVREVCWGTLWLSSVPRESSRAQRGQETWMATRCHHAMKWRVQETWPQNSPLIHVVYVCVRVCVPWRRLAETRAQHRRREHTLLTSPSLLDVMLKLGSQLGECTACQVQFLMKCRSVIIAPKCLLRALIFMNQ